jgi:hypothetical protein
MLEREGSAGGGLTPAMKPMRKTFAACCAGAGTLNAKSAAPTTMRENFLMSFSVSFGESILIGPEG